MSDNLGNVVLIDINNNIIINEMSHQALTSTQQHQFLRNAIFETSGNCYFLKPRAKVTFYGLSSQLTIIA